MTTIIVTGGAGFIGSNLCDALLARRDKVICIDNFNDYYNVGIKEENIAHNLGKDNFVLYRVDILDEKRMREIFSQEKPEKIIHLAARAGVRPSLEDPLLYQQVNLAGTMILLELAREFAIKVFIFGSSSSVYGNCTQIPFSEEMSVDFPISPYAATKKSGELLCYTYHHLYGIKVTCLRFFTVYGPRGRPDMAPIKFTHLIDTGKEIPIFGNGDSSRDYTYVGDIVHGILAALDKEFSYEIFNLGNSQPVNLSEFISILENMLGKTARKIYLNTQPGDVSTTYADITKSRRMLGYAPQVSLREGIQKMVAWYQGNKHLFENKNSNCPKGRSIFNVSDTPSDGELIKKQPTTSGGASDTNETTH